jgi:hypothetical protein
MVYNAQMFDRFGEMRILLTHFAAGGAITLATLGLMSVHTGNAHVDTVANAIGFAMFGLTSTFGGAVIYTIAETIYMVEKKRD